MRIDARWIVGGALIVAALNFLHSMPRDPPLRAPAFGYDFRALYCAGAVGSRGADPYRAEPLRTCERDAGEFGAPTNLVVPEPIPGYNVALFGALARMPVNLAGTLWTALLAVAFLVSIVALRSVTGLGVGIVVAALALDVWSSIVLGQMAPLVVAALAVCGWLLERRQFAGAAVAAACTMIEPHIGIAVCLALAIAVPRSRLALGICAVALVGISIAVLGVDGNLDFLLHATPGQVRAEAAAQEQYSLTYVLYRLGLGETGAVIAGSIWYVVAIGAAIGIAQRMVAQGQGSAVIAFLPAAAAVFGGPYVHLHQIVAAVPAALLLSARVAPYRTLFAWSVVLLAIPWGRFLDLRSALLFVPIATAVLVAYLAGASWRRASIVALCAGVLVEALLIAILPGPRTFDERALAAFSGASIPAYTIWAAFIRGIVYPPATDVVFILSKVPTFAGLALLAVASVLCVSKSPRQSGA